MNLGVVTSGHLSVNLPEVIDLIIHLVILDKICVYQMYKVAYIIELLLLVGLCACYFFRKWQSIPLFLPGKSHGQRNLAGYSPKSRKELNTTERLYIYSVCIHVYVYIYIHIFVFLEG